jgi:putative ABC transport system permease protein
MIVSGIRHRLGRTAALVGGIVVAAASFAVLAGASTTAQLQVVGTVERQAPTPYDILVRPRDAASGLEMSESLVQRNFLSGTFGGITLRQLRTVERVPGVEVAAPIALAGYLLPEVSVPVRLGGVLGAGTRQLFRVRTTWTADRGLTRIRDTDATST